jgi:hypothetical protein
MMTKEKPMCEKMARLYSMDRDLYEITKQVQSYGKPAPLLTGLQRLIAHNAKLRRAREGYLYVKPQRSAHWICIPICDLANVLENGTFRPYWPTPKFGGGK